MKNYKTQHTAEANDDPKFCSDSCAKLLRFFLRGTLISNTFYGSSSNICLAHCPVHLQYISMTTTFQCLDFHQIIYIDNLMNRPSVFSYAPVDPEVCKSCGSNICGLRLGLKISASCWSYKKVRSLHKTVQGCN